MRVHHNSPRPAALGANACTQGAEIHIGPGQERSLAHEAWHVVQQRQGRVRATRTTGGVPVNDNAALEREADRAGQAGPLASPQPARRPAAGHPAPVQLDKTHVDRRLAKYRKKQDISEADLQRLLVIFAGWEADQVEADKTSPAFPSGWYRRQAQDKITKGVIEALNADTEISSVIRRRLVKAWNMKTKAHDQVVFRAPPPAKQAAFEPGEVPLWAPMSPFAESYQGGFEPMDVYELTAEPESPPEKEGKKEKKKRKKHKGESESGSGSEGDKTKKRQKRKSKTFRTGTGAKKEETPVAVVDYAPEAALMIRSFQKQESNILGGFKIIWGPGMFHKGPYEDIVYSLLTEASSGIFIREGGVDTWEAILQQVPDKYWKNPRLLIHLVQAGLRGWAPAEPEIALVCGAMICDVKHGIGTWLRLLGELYPMLPGPSAPKLKPAAMQKLFLEWYEYSASGGRNLSKRKTRRSYQEQSLRVKTTEWDKATIIPSRGGFDFPDAGGVPMFVTSTGEKVPEFPDDRVLKAAMEYGDPADFWTLAMTNKYLYNYLARRYRRTRALMPK